MRPNLQLVLAAAQPTQPAVAPNLESISKPTSTLQPSTLTLSTQGHIPIATPSIPVAVSATTKITQEKGESKTKFEHRQKLTDVAQTLFPTSTTETNVLLGRAAANKVIDGVTYDKQLEDVILYIIQQAKTTPVK